MGKEEKNHKPEEQVELLAFISQPIKAEIHYEVNSPILHAHPFFHYYDQSFGAAMKQISHKSVSRCCLHAGDILFTGGDFPEDPKMFFITQGDLQYVPMHEADLKLRSVSSNIFHVGPGTWACEA